MQGMAYWTGHNRWLSPVGPVQQTNLILLSKQKIDEAVHDRNRVQKERGKPYTGRKRNEKTKQNKTKQKEVAVSDEVLLQKKRQNKLTQKFLWTQNHTKK